MPRLAGELLEPKQVMLFKSDLDFLRKRYGDNVGANKAIRSIVRAFVIQTRAAADRAIDRAEGAAGVPGAAGAAGASPQLAKNLPAGLAEELVE